MAGRGHAPRHFWLSSQAAFAAERLAEIAGVPAGELVEMVLLELPGSGEIVEAEVGAKGKQSTSVARRGPARVIPIARGRRLAGPLGATHRDTAPALRDAAPALQGRPPPGRAVRENSTSLRLRCGGAAVPGL
jgi:hypothetical protein